MLMARLWGSMLNDNKSWRKLTNKCFVLCGFAFWLFFYCLAAHWQHIGNTLYKARCGHRKGQQCEPLDRLLPRETRWKGSQESWKDRSFHTLDFASIMAASCSATQPASWPPQLAGMPTFLPPCAAHRCAAWRHGAEGPANIPPCR